MKNQIKIYREKAKLSQQKLAEKIGVTQGTIGLYERGLREPNIETIAKLATALNCKPTELFPVLEG